MAVSREIVRRAAGKVETVFAEAEVAFGERLKEAVRTKNLATQEEKLRVLFRRFPCGVRKIDKLTGAQLRRQMRFQARKLGIKITNG